MNKWTEWSAKKSGERSCCYSYSGTMAGKNTRVTKMEKSVECSWAADRNIPNVKRGEQMMLFRVSVAGVKDGERLTTLRVRKTSQEPQMNADDSLNVCEPAAIWTWSVYFVELLKLQFYFWVCSYSYSQPFILLFDHFLWNICYLNRLHFLLFPICPLGVFRLCWKRSTRLHSHPPSVLPLSPFPSLCLVPSQSCLFQLSSEPWVISVATRGRDMLENYIHFIGWKRRWTPCNTVCHNQWSSPCCV